MTIKERIERGWKARAQRITLDEMYELRTAIWDIEAGGLDANYDVMLCATIKELGGKLKTFAIAAEPWNDRELVVTVRNHLEKFDVVVHHYGDRYDVPFLDTRLLINHEPLLDKKDTVFVDTWRALRMYYKLNRNRLATIIDAIGTPTHKTPLDGPIWIKAKAGDRSALTYIIKHNVADVLALEEITKRLASVHGLPYRYRK